MPLIFLSFFATCCRCHAGFSRYMSAMMIRLLFYAMPPFIALPPMPCCHDADSRCCRHADAYLQRVYSRAMQRVPRALIFIIFALLRRYAIIAFAAAATPCFLAAALFYAVSMLPIFISPAAADADAYFFISPLAAFIFHIFAMPPCC